MPSDRPRRRFEDDDDRDEPAPRRRKPDPPWLLLGGLAGAGLVALAIGVGAVLWSWPVKGRPAAGQQVAQQPEITATSADQPPPAPKPEWRWLDKAGRTELALAWHDNPEAAKRKYAKVRWRVSDFKPYEFSAASLRTVAWQDCLFEFRTADEVAKLSKSRGVLIEATCEAYENTRQGPLHSFVDAVVVPE